ncbi:alpha/beta fold hydrolase [Sphaerisporangium rubeum]|uniref:Surfactin synthase thioesterase subunit n=1 Tax=Sphaerisporangium rubeum TaxID=321317 RepID=A0A7X0I9C5_9ACTN|nr:surfactin synthase thioesterase subunit [Sphaerisporangium rubeum]
MKQRAHLEPSPEPRLRLYCLPHAGGGAAHYNRWRPVLPGVLVTPLELPGHGTRLAEPPIRDMNALVASLVATISTTIPFVLFGHSFGALVAYELALRLPPESLAGLVVSGRNAPSEPPAADPLHVLPDGPFIARLRRLGGMPEELLDDPGLLRLYLPALRADLEMSATGRPAADPRLRAPITVFGAWDDDLTRPDGLAAWARETTGPFELAMLPGGHFFLRDPGFPVLLRARLDRMAAAVSR